MPIEKKSTEGARTARGERCGGHLHHDAGLELRAVPHRPSSLLQQFERAVEFVDRGHHGEHHANREVGRHPEDGAQLREEQVGACQPQSHASHAEERVRLGRLAEVGERFVRAGIEGSQQQRAAVERLGGEAVGGFLLVLGPAWRPDP